MHACFFRPQLKINFLMTINRHKHSFNARERHSRREFKELNSVAHYAEGMNLCSRERTLLKALKKEMKF